MSDELAEKILAEVRELREEIKALRSEVKSAAAKEDRSIPDHPMSPADVAKIVGRTEKTVRKWITDGRLRVRHIERVMLITPDSLRKFLMPL